MAIGIFIGFLFYRPVQSTEDTLEYILDYNNEKHIINSLEDNLAELSVITSGMTDHQILTAYVSHYANLCSDYKNEYESIIKEYMFKYISSNGDVDKSIYNYLYENNKILKLEQIIEGPIIGL